MSSYLGDFRTGKTVRKMFNTNAVAGESITIATNGTVQVYKDGGTTQSTTGVTFTEDFDSLTGVHLVAIDTSADGTFYSAGSDFEAVLAGATIDGKAVNAPLFSFSLENRSALLPTTDGRKLTVSAGGAADADAKAVNGSTTAAANLATTNAALETGTAQAGGASTITLRSGASAVNDFYKDQAVWVLSGAGAGQSNRVASYVGSTKVATVETAWATQPDNTSVYVVVGRVQ